MATVRELHSNYKGDMGKIGYMQYNREDALLVVKKHISKEFISKLSDYQKKFGTIFNMYTYTTKEDGSQEIIQDFHGKYYGLNHEIINGFWGFDN